MRFYDAFGVPEKSVFTRLFSIFATAMLANFQDRLVMTTSISHSEIDKLAVACVECGYLRRRRTIPLMHTVHYHRIFNSWSFASSIGSRLLYFITFPIDCQELSHEKRKGNPTPWRKVHVYSLRLACYRLSRIRYVRSAITRHASFSRSCVHAAFAGLVEGRRIASLPITGARYWQ